ncbi:MAG: cytidylate kinase-like family protein [Bacteroidetes bacterium]|nr:cytidylate kinase-like family protein [Bacteroidota bacterium]
MSAITISRKLGSMGSYIGRKLAEELGYSYIDKNLISKIMKDYGFSRLDTIYETVPSLIEKFDIYRDMAIKFLAEVIITVAHHGNVVIAGRGSFGLLDSYSDVINIRIKAPDICRVHRIMQDRNITEPEAIGIMQENDRVRRSFVESDFHFNYTDSTKFDIMLDTSIINPEICIRFLKEAIIENKGIREDSRPRVSDMVLEPVLVKHVDKMLSYFDSHKEEILKKIEL